jgi:hypothetical protein
MKLNGELQPISPLASGLIDESPAEELEPGGVIEGESDLSYFLNAEALSRDEEWLLIWSYGAHVEMNQNSPWVLTGVARVRSR